MFFLGLSIQIASKLKSAPQKESDRIQGSANFQAGFSTGIGGGTIRNLLSKAIRRLFF